MRFWRVREEGRARAAGGDVSTLLEILGQAHIRGDNSGGVVSTLLEILGTATPLRIAATLLEAVSTLLEILAE